jgi:hypothetical protein
VGTGNYFSLTVLSLCGLLSCLSYYLCFLCRLKARAEEEEAKKQASEKAAAAAKAAADWEAEGTEAAAKKGKSWFEPGTALDYWRDSEAHRKFDGACAVALDKAFRVKAEHMSRKLLSK